MDIALIDGGLSSEGKLRNKIAEKIEFVTAEKTDINNGYSGLVHGTTCAEIILDVCPDVQFLDLKVMYQDGTTKISVLLEALEFCIQHKIKLINLSLGSVNYFDMGPLELCINKLVAQDAIIVAAYHNSNIRTYPAAFPGIFGVRQDRYGILKKQEFLFQEQREFLRENSIVAHWCGKDENNLVNSYAAPVITGHIASYLLINQEARFDEVSAYLAKNSKQNKVYPDKVDKLFRKSQNIETPVIAGIGLQQEVLPALTEIFLEKEYQTLLLAENPIDEKAIPINHYYCKDESWAHILYTVNRVYEPDIIFIDLVSNEIYCDARESQIDLYINYENGVYKIYAEHLIGAAKDLDGISDIIYEYFK